MSKLPKITSLLFPCNILRRNWVMKLICCMQIRMKVSDKLILQFLTCSFPFLSAEYGSHSAALLSANSSFIHQLSLLFFMDLLTFGLLDRKCFSVMVKSQTFKILLASWQLHRLLPSQNTFFVFALVIFLLRWCFFSQICLSL